MSVTTPRAYHHGNLRASLLSAAMQRLEQGEPFSLRGIAREVGVSPTAPYRHFTDRDALESALAAQGLQDLLAELVEGRELPTTPAELTELAVAYVDFGLRRPALFRLMFGNACDEGNAERVEAAGRIHALLEAAMHEVYPDADADALASAGWALAHGLVYLHLDGKLPYTSNAEVAARVRSAFEAILSVSSR